MLFKPTRPDGRSFRDVAVDALKDREPETLVSYADIGAAIDLDPTADLQKIQMTVRAANMVLLKTHSRAVTNVRGFGYRVIPAREHKYVAIEYQGKADKAVGRSIAFFDGANLKEMTAQERKVHEGLSLIAHQLGAMHTYNKQRFDRLEALFKGPIVDGK